MTIFHMIVLNWISLFSSLFLKNDFDQKENLTVQQIKSKTNIKNHLKKNDKVQILNLIDQKNNEQKYIDELNKEEIFLLVTDGFSEKDKKIKKGDLNEKRNNLLLIHTQDRLSNTFPLKESRFNKIFLKGKQEGFRIKSGMRNDKLRVDEMVRPFELKKLNDFPGLNVFLPKILCSYFRSPKVYYHQNTGGYKSICPVFFDKKQAEIFLKQVYEENLGLLSILPIESQSEILNGISGTKIIQVGLGDFINFYSNKESKVLNQVDFLFFPKEKDIKKLLKRNLFTFFSSEKKIPSNSFYSYYKKIPFSENTLKLKKDSVNDWQYNIDLTSSLKNSQSYLDYYENKYKDNFLKLDNSTHKLLGINLKI